jgi:hypothetical protein
MSGGIQRRMFGLRRNSVPARTLIPSERGWRSMGILARHTSGGPS